jgi:hypothetical protein
MLLKRKAKLNLFPTKMTNMLNRTIDYKTNSTFVENIDFFHFIIENNIERSFGLAISILNVLLCPPLLICIIWFERFGSDKKRTLLNRLVSMNCWTGIEFLSLSQIPEIVRFIYGPLPDLFCYIHVIFRNAFMWMFLLYIDAILIVRYIFIFYLKNPAAFNDDFWSNFIGIWIHGFSLISLFVWHTLSKFQTMAFCMCTGQNFAENRNNFPKARGVLEATSIILHIIIYLRIFVYKMKHENLNINSDKQSLFTYSYNIFGIAVTCSVIFAMKRLEHLPVEQLISYPNYFFFHYINLVAPSLFFLIVIASFFKNTNLRRYVILEIREICTFFA